MRNVFAEERLLERYHRLNIAFFERHEGKAPTPARHLVSHYRDIYDLTEALKVSLHVSLYLQPQKQKQSDKAQ